MRNEGLDALIIYGIPTWADTNIEYLTNYSPPFPAYLVTFSDPEEDPSLFIGINNHFQYVREVSVIDDLRLMLPDPASSIAERINGTTAEDGKIGLVSVDSRYKLSMAFPHYSFLNEELEAEFVEASAHFERLMSIKSDEEIERLKRAAASLDLAMEALEEQVTPGMRENDLRSVLQSGVPDEGGRVTAALVSTAPMKDAEPGECLPWKSTPTNRVIQDGDILTTEISVSREGMSSQIHRPYAIGKPPTDRYWNLYEVAHETYKQIVAALQPGNTARDVHAAMETVEASPYKIYDVMTHGYGNGYLPPYIGTKQSDYWPGMDDSVTGEWVFEENMVIVVQPNVVTDDECEGLQLGATVVIRDDGPEVIQEYPIQFAEL